MGDFARFRYPSFLRRIARLFASFRPTTGRNQAGQFVDGFPAGAHIIQMIEDMDGPPGSCVISDDA